MNRHPFRVFAARWPAAGRANGRGFSMARFGGAAFSKPDDGGSGNPDPTMKKPGGATGASPKGENMPPLGGEDIAPADRSRSPGETQKRVKDEMGTSD